MPSITLNDIQTAADKKFGDFELVLPNGETVSFIPALRLPKETRRKIGKAFDVEARAKIEGNDDDIFDIYKDVFRICERRTGDFDKLEAVVGDDPAVWQELSDNFLNDTQAGEV
jgi:hypothetical protein